MDTQLPFNVCMTGEGELVHPKDTNSIAISGLGYRKTFADIGRTTCHLWHK